MSTGEMPGNVRKTLSPMCPSGVPVDRGPVPCGPERRKPPVKLVVVDADNLPANIEALRADKGIWVLDTKEYNELLDMYDGQLRKKQQEVKCAVSDFADVTLKASQSIAETKWPARVRGTNRTPPKKKRKK